MSDRAEEPTSLREPSLALLERARAGDTQALNLLITRYRPRLVRWVRHRLQPAHRDLADTDDLVQNTLLKVVRNLDGFATDSAFGFQHYLRTALGNAVRDEVKKAGRRPCFEAVDWSMASDTPSPHALAESRERLRRYEEALARLDPDEREAVIARFELGFTHEELAAALGKATPDAARKVCRKAIGRLLVLMRAGLDA